MSGRQVLCVAAVVIASISLPVAGAAGSVSKHANLPAVAQPSSDPPEAVHHDVSQPLRDISPAPAPSPGTKKEKEPKRGLPVPAAGASDPVAQLTPGSASAAALGVSFEGVGQGFTGPSGTFSVTSAPPDPNATVGPNQIVEIVNQSFAVFSKSGTAIYGPVPTNTVWSGFGGGCQSNDDGDATVEYDKLANRWIISQFSVSTTPYLQCVAVSTSGDPTGSYFRYSFQYGNFPDYPKLGVWPDAYYTTFNMFSRHGNHNTFVGPEACAYDRGKMLLGQAATQQCFLLGSSFGSLLPADLDGTTPPPTGSPNYLLSFATNSLLLWKFHVNWTTPSSSTLSGPTTIPVASFSPACAGGICIPQPGTSQQLDSLADRLMYRLAYRNFGDHESLVVNHSVIAGSSVGVRWYELRNPGGTPTVYQQGTYAPDSSYRWMGSIAMDQSGDIALGYSISSSSISPGIRYTGRLAGDQLGLMTQGEGTIINGAGSQTGNLARWGDYTSMSVDPSDDCTFWYTNEYFASSGSFNWHTRIGSFKFPNCGSTQQSDFSIGASPSSLSVAQGSSGTSSISTAVTSGSAQSVSLSASGLPASTSASFSPASVTSGGSSTMTLSVGAATAVGSYTITVTGTGGSATHTTSLTLTVTAPTVNDFSISASPTSLSLVQGANGTSTISTGITSGSPQSVSLSASGLPTGAAASFNPASVTSGASSTMTVSVGPATTPGSYTITVTGTGTSATHSTTVALTVTPPTTDDFSISASPSSVSVVQGFSGATTINTAVTSGSAQSVSLSASGLPTGSSANFKPASVTAGGSSTMEIITGSATPGTYTITVTGTGTSATHSTTVTLTVTAAVASDFSIAASPSSVTVAQGASGASTISTAVTSGSAQTVSLSASGQPAGVAVGFNPTAVTTGGSSTMTITVGSAIAPGSYSIAVTGTGTSATHSTTVTLTVTAAVTKIGSATGSFTTLKIPTSGAVIGHLLVLAYAISIPNDSITSVTDSGGNTWRKEIALANQASVEIEVWTAPCIANPGTITVFDAQGQGGTGYVYDMSGVDTSSGRTDAAVAGATASTQHPSINIATVNATDTIFMLSAAGGWSGSAPGSSYTELDDAPAFLSRQMYTEWTVMAAGTHAADFTFTSAAQNVATVAAAFKQGP